MFILQSYFKVSITLIFLTFFIKENITAQNQSTFPKKVKATYYSSKFKGKKTYSGERYDPQKFTAAHKSLPMNTFIKVINPKNQKVVVVKINDRFGKSNFIDLSWIAAKEIGIIKQGVAYVLIEPVDTSVNNENLKQYFLPDTLFQN